MNNDNNAKDPMEEELGLMRPRELSAGFMESLGRRLGPAASDDDGLRPRRSRLIKFSAPLTAIAALILVAIWLGPSRHSRDVAAPSGQEIVSPEIAPLEERAGNTPPPTLVAYHRAITGQPGTLEELLDYHARTLLPKVPD